MPLWKVRALAYYPREPWNPDNKPPLYTVKRPDMYSKVPRSWGSKGLGRVAVPVEVESKEEARRIAQDSDYIERVDGPITLCETLPK